MDKAAALTSLSRWLELAKKERLPAPTFRGESFRSPFIKDSGTNYEELQKYEHQVQAVVCQVLQLEDTPRFIHPASGGEADISVGLDLVAKAISVLETEEETLKIIGSTAPSMNADSLHSLIWDAAAPLWRGKHYSNAVQAAATALSGELRNRIERHDLGDAQLIDQALGTSNPKKGECRLRWPGADDDLTVKAMRTGIHHLAKGAFSAIRNPVSHTTEALPRQEAFEQLAILSTLARWIERCERVVGAE